MTCPPQIAAVAAVMDEIDQCRNPEPCDLCQQRMQSILDMGAAAERKAMATALREPVSILTGWLEHLPQRHVPLRAAEALLRLRNLTAPGDTP